MNASVGINVFLDGFERLLAIVSVITEINGGHLKTVPHNYLYCLDIEHLIIYNQNSVLVWQFLQIIVLVECRHFQVKSYFITS